MNRENLDDSQVQEKRNKTSSTALQRKDCKKHQLNLEAAALICTTKATGNTELTGINKNIFTEKRKKSLAPALNNHIQPTLASEFWGVSDYEQS